MNLLVGCVNFVTFFITIIEVDANFQRSFVIDYPNNQFLRDGKPFRYVAGCLHYFRVPSVLWSDRMIKYKAAGLNAIQTYVEWSFHEQERGIYNFEDDRNLSKFLDLANQHDLLVVLRPGPFIDTERDFGGFPSWLLQINPDMKVRTSDPSYLAEVDRWLSVLFTRLKPFLYKNGGPIISVQVENEYGSYGCDFEYTSTLRNMFHKYLSKDVVLFTDDNNFDEKLKCGKIDNVYATIDFGPETDPKTAFAVQRRHQQFGPLVNSEFYPGWNDWWEHRHVHSKTGAVCKALDKMLQLNASVTICMWHGGTSFGFGAGSNMLGDEFAPIPTSYDYDAPLNEAGDPTTKYHAMRQVISKYLPLPPIPVPQPSKKMKTDPISMFPVASIFDFSIEAIKSKYPLTFEQLELSYGFVLYSTTINFTTTDPAVLKIPGLADRAQVFVDKNYQGTLSRTRKMFTLPIHCEVGAQLDIFVENQGRLSVGPSLGEFKGITSKVTLDSVVLEDWRQFRVFKDWPKVINELERLDKRLRKVVKNVPTIFSGEFVLPDDADLPRDAFLRVDQWRKGVAFLNGFNLGRYWPVAGPQVTLYTPAHLFNKHPQVNRVTVFELEPACQHDCRLQFVEQHVLNGTVPYE